MNLNHQVAFKERVRFSIFACFGVLFLLAGQTDLRGEDGYTGHRVDGKEVVLLQLKNDKGLRVDLTNYGARITRLEVPDRQGRPVDVVLGQDSLEKHLNSGDAFFGATVGRYANRIKNGRFSLDGTVYQLTRNDRRGPNHVHGGKKAFHNSVWDVTEQTPQRVRFALKSRDGEEGYPGDIDITVTYSIGEENGVRIDYRATTDRVTIFNPTHHSYFNLDGGETILGHVLMIRADRYTPVDAEQIPLGERRTVDGSAFDFRTPTPIGSRNRSEEEQIRTGKGYNHNFVLNKTNANEPEIAARVFSPKSGIAMEILTTEPGLQIYDCGWYDGSITGKGGRRYGRFAGFAAETQHFPDSPNNPSFPSTRLDPGREYRQTTIYRFSITP